jgi:hypothetical protein
LNRVPGSERSSCEISDRPPLPPGGPARRDKCIAIVDSSPDGDLLAQIGDEREVEGYIASQQLEVHATEENYLHLAPFSPEAMIEFWESRVGPAIKGGSFDFARSTGEVPLDVRTPHLRTAFFRYEAALEGFAPRYPQTLLCLYDLARFGGGFLVDILRTHPKLLMGGLILENPHYRPAGDFVPATA